MAASKPGWLEGHKGSGLCLARLPPCAASAKAVLSGVGFHKPLGALPR